MVLTKRQQNGQAIPLSSSDRASSSGARRSPADQDGTLAQAVSEFALQPTPVADKIAEPGDRFKYTDAHSASYTAEQLFMSEFRRSNFMQFLVQYEMAAVSQVAHLRMENERLQSQLALPGNAARKVVAKQETVSAGGDGESQLVTCHCCSNLTRADLSICWHCGAKFNGAVAYQERAEPNSHNNLASNEFAAEPSVVTCPTCLGHSRADLSICWHCGSRLNNVAADSGSDAHDDLRSAASNKGVLAVPETINSARTVATAPGIVEPPQRIAHPRPPSPALFTDKHLSVNRTADAGRNHGFSKRISDRSAISCETPRFSPRGWNQDHGFRPVNTRGKSMLQEPSIAKGSVVKALYMVENGRHALRKVNDGAMFVDVENMKDQVRKAAARPQYNVHDYYNETGCFQAIAKHPWFEFITLAVIAFNAIWIAIETDHNTEALLSDAHPAFQIADHGFCLYFTAEWVIRLLSFKRKRDCLRDFWFVFDATLVTLMVFETWVLYAVVTLSNFKKGDVSDTSILKLVRLTRMTRMARMARLLKVVPELTILIKGMVVAARSVFFTLCLLTIIIYVFAIALKQLTNETTIGDLYFNSVPESMKTLLLEVTMPDLANFINEVGHEHVFYAIVMLLFVLLASLTVMNMLVGVLVEVVSVVSAVEKEQLKVSFVKNKLQEMIEVTGLDSDGDILISRPEFASLLLNPRAVKIIQDVGVDPVGLVDFTDYIFKDEIGNEGPGLTFEDFIEIIMQFRGKNTSTVKDIVDLRKVLHKELADLSLMIGQQALKLGELNSACRHMIEARGFETGLRRAQQLQELL